MFYCFGECETRFFCLIVPAIMVVEICYGLTVKILVVPRFLVKRGEGEFGEMASSAPFRSGCLFQSFLNSGIA